MNREEFKIKHGIISQSGEIDDLVDVVMQVSSSDITVLIYGESGVGKEVFAKAIHNSSKRAGQELISVNCGAIPEGILESELFGHKKGAFTGAFEGRKGYFEIADGGTLFLDEIAEMPLTTQVKVLRAIEFKEFMRIGAETVTKVDVRIIAATNKDLQQEVNSRKFREDLYFRLKAVSLNIPPLRKRKGDIELLANHFLEHYAKANKLTAPKISDEAMDLLIEYNWPGNVRELKNTIETALTLNRNGLLDVNSFSDLLVTKDENSSMRHLPVFLRKSPEDADRELLYRALFEIKKDLIELKDLVINTSREQTVKTEEPKKNLFALDIIERDTIKAALDKTRGNKRKASRLLNISERTLYRKIKQYDLLEE
ncbi:MAG: sigma-54-dependent Fis family transcriptional regulator [Ignavibacteriota bacterium]|nr:MAG: sigma-54-dependent Fis family transcriptional regulator [Chlorobiota bacterium]MBE7475123.1 sigma-54-dependent Fis family transcriptional regulator [Ignavibacteriales bacterium]MBL1122535.1 sigma-54-dependent Fis family transcriptional regulator [Ignavibacteriota bacterium]MCE7855926.1 sigma-54-dependent Fis family transcriptional regulator [Ignavibacteria bacterium CHB3]MEB2296118.1 sigma-54 dependent transcriptional regulator [Ignavibacteria bacterium]NUM61831.1 sigma-54-dependent Fi